MKTKVERDEKQPAAHESTDSVRVPLPAPGCQCGTQESCCAGNAAIARRSRLRGAGWCAMFMPNRYSKRYVFGAFAGRISSSSCLKSLRSRIGRDRVRSRGRPGRGSLL